MELKLYGQAEYYYAVQKEILARLVKENVISEEQCQRIDELDRKVIFELYPSVAELEVGT